MDLCHMIERLIDDEKSAANQYDVLREQFDGAPEAVLVEFIMRTEEFHRGLLEDLYNLYCKPKEEGSTS